VLGAADLADHERRMLVVLDAVTGASGTLVGSVELLAPHERRAVLELSAPPQRAVDEISWTTAFERRAALDPGAVAVVCDEIELSYGQLEERSGDLARTLLARGVGHEEIVAVAMPRSAEMIVALLGVMRTGAAYLPLDLDHPPDRIAFMLRDSGVRIVVTDSDLVGELPARRRAASAARGRATTGRRALRAARHVGLEQAAYAIYTSGSTGQPKAVVVSHEGIGSLIATAVDRLGVDARSRVAQFASVGFDVAVWDLCMTLGVGGCAVVVPASRRVAAAPLTDYLTEQRVTHMILPPSLVAALPPDCLLPQGAVLVVGTETVQAQLVARWSQRLRIVVAYGVTEATVNSTLWPAQPGWVGPVPIGRPDPNTRA
jgi:non-ribosomal peptide synthetase component F